MDFELDRISTGSLETILNTPEIEEELGDITDGRETPRRRCRR